MKKVLAILLTLIIIVSGAIFFLNKGSGGNNNFSNAYDSYQVIIGGQLVDKDDCTREDGQYYFSTDFIEQYFQGKSDYNEATKTLTFLNETGTKVFTVGEKKALYNGKEIALRDPIFTADGKVYLPMEAFLYDYPVWAKYFQDENILVIESLKKKYASAKPSGNGVNMREEPSTNAPIVKIFNAEDEMVVYDEKDNWYKVRSASTGYTGYIRGDNLNVEPVEGQLVIDLKETSKSAIQKPITITWDYTYSTVKEEVINAIAPIPGLDVIIPTWFSIADGEGNVIDRGDMRYMERYTQLGIDVWGYVDNQFNRELTMTFLHNDAARSRAIDKLIERANYYGMKGINVDFENIEIDDRDALTTFVSELSERAKQHGLIISVCVTPQISSNIEEEPYNRAALSEVSDYVILMAYDQNWSSSDKAGSVAEYKWVESNINLLMRDIPREKFILGMPFYTRLWTEQGENTESTLYSMDTQNNYIATNGLNPTWDDDAKQFYVERNADGKTEKIWLENGDSIRWKTSLVRKYNLAGVATWRLGFQTPDIWNVISDEMSHYTYRYTDQ